MPETGPFSLDQLQVFLTVVEQGSFAAAARHTGRANSAISYAIDTLEANLGVTLFVRGSTRKPMLTPEGEAVLSEARWLSHGAQLLRARVAGLREGLEAEVSLTVDEMFPEERLIALLQAFHDRFPTVPVRLDTQVMAGVAGSLDRGDSVIGIGGLLHITGKEFTRYDIDAVRIIPVAAASHPLSLAHRPRAGESHEHLQIVLSERSDLNGINYGVVGSQIWRVGSLRTKYQLLLGGIGWGGLPEPMVVSDIQAGRLVHLDLPDWRGGDYLMQVVHRTDVAPGPAARWIIGLLMKGRADFPASA